MCQAQWENASGHSALKWSGGVKIKFYWAAAPHLRVFKMNELSSQFKWVNRKNIMTLEDQWQPCSSF